MRIVQLWVLSRIRLLVGGLTPHLLLILDSYFPQIPIEIYH